MTAQFSVNQAQALTDFLNDQHRPDGTLNYPQLAGFLFAVCCSPELVQADDWMSVIFDDQDPGYFNEKEDKQVQGDLVALYQWIRQGIADKAPSLPPLCEARAEIMDNFSPGARLSLWCQGFLTGHDWLEEVWHDHLDDEKDDILGRCLICLSFFASEQLAQEWQAELEQENRPLEELAQQQVADFNDAMRDYAALGCD